LTTRFGSLPLISLAGVLASGNALAQDNTPNYLERVIQWTTQAGERCSDVAEALYGRVEDVALVKRYNDVDCGRPLPEGTTLVLPEQANELPIARVRSMNPDVRARPPGSDWQPASPGLPLYENYSVGTFESARADVLFADRSRIYLGEHTLVVIYGSAEASNLSVAPNRIDLQEGEIMAGILALGGKPVGLTTAGGSIRAASKDAVVRTRGDRSTVSVFDGSVELNSGGQKVSVPTNFGSAFRKNTKPIPPRPLPPAPNWAPGATHDLALGLGQEVDVSVTWQSVPAAVGYRVEMAQDEVFSTVLFREEVASSVLSLRAKGFPSGTYFVRVRAIDGEDFLGLPSVRAFTTASVRMPGASGQWSGDTLVTSNYANLELTSSSVFYAAGDDGEFKKCPCSWEAAELPKHKLQLRLAPEREVLSVPLQVLSAEAKLVAEFGAQDARGRLLIHFTGLEGLNPSLFRPTLRIYGAGKVQEVALKVVGAKSDVSVSSSEFSTPTRVDVIDSNGKVLGSTMISAPTAPKTVTASVRDVEVMPTAGFFAVSRRTGVAPWSFGAPSSASFGLAASGESGRLQSVLRGRGRIDFENWRLDAGISSEQLSGNPELVGNDAWLGASILPYRPSRNRRLGIGARLGFPISERDAWRPELAFGWEISGAGFGFAAHTGLRASLSHAAATEYDAFALLGLTVPVVDGVVAYSLLDAHAVLQGAHSDERGGLALGFELGSQWFADLGCRLSPWDADGGMLSGQVLFGVRAP
jgi:hypothetical protein